ncbi:MAG: FAD-dependent oxidoreductase [Candidatus Hadarchaeota archaeon]
MSKIVVIGGGAAGLKAASRARRRDENAEITVIEKSEYLSVCRCGMPYFIEDLIHDISDLQSTPYGMVRDADFFKKVKNINVLRGEAKSIDRSSKVVKVERNGSIEEVSYDYLVLAIGTKPTTLNISGINAKGVFKLTNPDDALAITDFWKNEDPEGAVIIGSGPVGLECAEALSTVGLGVTVVEVMDTILPQMLDPEMSQVIRKHLEDNEVRVKTSSQVNEVINENGKVTGVRIGDEIVDAQMVLIAAGIRPNVGLARDAGLEVDVGVKVNRYLQTSDPFIYAGGDCVENIHVLTGQSVYTPLGSVANKHGRVIGDNVTGGKSEFRGVAGTMIFRVMDMNVTATGLREVETKKLGYDVVTAIIPGPDRYHHYPDRKNLTLKMIADREGTLLGAQAVGEGVVDKRIDVISTAIQLKANIEDLTTLDHAYSPPFSSGIDLVTHAANMIKNKLEGLIESISVIELKEKLDSNEDFILLDVRTEKEFQKSSIPDYRVVHIPLNQLRGSLHLLDDKQKEIIVVCQIGSRAYEAARVLVANGYNTRIADGCMALWTFG